MANIDTPFGLKSRQSVQAAAYMGQIHPYTVPATDSTALFIGDAVKLTGESGNGEDGQNHAIITQAAATDTLVGVVIGFFPSRLYENQNYRTASTLRTVYVLDDPYAQFEIQTNGTSTTGDVGALADIVVGSGSIITGQSAMELDQTTVGSGTQLRIYGFELSANNTIGEFSKIIVLIADHQYKVSTGV